MKSLSVIVPVYNDNKNLVNALNSIVVQNYSDCQVFVCDDCSDVSPQSICNEFSNKLNIKYLKTKANGGAAAARNVGLDELKNKLTDYVCFIDSDDAFLPYAFKIFSEAVNKKEYDIIVTQIAQEGKEKVVFGDELNSWAWLHGKFYKTDFLFSKNIKFPTALRTNEDSCFNLIAKSKTENICFIDTPTYYWQRNINSITRSGSIRQYQCKSVHYIEAIYIAFNELEDKSKVFPSLINCYTAYQYAICYKLNLQRVDKMLKKMFNDTKIKSMLSQLCTHCGFIQFPQWEFYQDTIYYFSQTFIQWVNKFISLEELKNGIGSN